MISFIFLGTSGGMPSKTRNSSSVIFRLQGQRKWTMVDCGEGTQHQLLNSGISPEKIEHILITHLHGDHCLGLPGLLSTRSLMGASGPLSITGPSGIRQFTEATLNATGCVLNYPLHFTETDTVTRSGNNLGERSGLLVESIPMNHSVSCVGYHFTQTFHKRRLLVEKLQSTGLTPGPLWSGLQNGKDVVTPEGRLFKASDFTAPPLSPLHFFIAGDNADISVLSCLAENLSLLVHEATFLESDRLRLKYAGSHSSLEQILAFARLYKIPGVVLTHFSPRYHSQSPFELSHEYLKVIPENERQNIILAHDLMRLSLSHEGVTRKSESD